MAHKSGADVDLDALGGGAAAASGKRGGKGARLFLFSMAGGLVASIIAASYAPESWIHSPPEFGMAEALEDHIEATCAAKATPELLIIGDSRAVAGVSARTIAAAGIDVEKFAIGGAGIFSGWAVLDRLIDCGVRPKEVVMAYGTVHVLEPGGLMQRTTNFDMLKGPRASYAYSKASEWEDSLSRRITYKAISYLGTQASLVDLVLLRPALKNVLEKPPVAISNHAVNEEERANYLARRGDRFYGTANGTSELPEEGEYEPDRAVPRMNHEATAAVAALAKEHGFGLSFYLLPVSETTMAKVPGRLFDTVEAFRKDTERMGMRSLNRVWTLPDADFGDPSHVNATGREKVTEDFLAKVAASQLVAGWPANKADDAVSLAAQKSEQIGQ